MQVSTDIDDVDLDGDYGIVPGIRITCKRCGYEVEVFDAADASKARGAVMLREECPQGENNFYEVD